MSLIGEVSSGDPADLMTTHSAKLSPLVQAVQHSVPQVRYEAAAAIARCRPLAGHELDGLYDLYVERIAEFRANPPPPDWDGVYVATSK